MDEHEAWPEPLCVNPILSGTKLIQTNYAREKQV